MKKMNPAKCVGGKLEFDDAEKVKERERKRKSALSNVAKCRQLDTFHVALNKSFKAATIFILTLEITSSLLNHQLNESRPTKIAPSGILTKGLLHIVVQVAASHDAYADASAESPAVEALDEDDDDDEELNASASNEYPDGDNDNDESYEDADGK